MIAQHVHFSSGPTYTCHGRKENTVSITSPWTLFTQALCSLHDSRTPDGKHCLSQQPQEKTYRTPVGKLELFMEAGSSHFELAITNSFFKEEPSAEDTAYDPTACK